MKKEEIVKTLMSIDSDQSKYIDGDFDEIKAICDEYGSFAVSPIGNGKCKVTKLKARKETFYGSLSDRLAAYDGRFELAEHVQRVRMAVSKYNREKGTSFSVRAVGDQVAEVYTNNIEDYATITPLQFKEYCDEVLKKVASLNSKVRPLEPKLHPYKGTPIIQPDITYEKLKEMTMSGMTKGDPIEVVVTDEADAPMADFQKSAVEDMEARVRFLKEGESFKEFHDRTLSEVASGLGLDPNEADEITDVEFEAHGVPASELIECTKCGEKFIQQGSSTLCGDCMDEDLL